LGEERRIMFYAISSKTKERVNSLNVEDNPAYQFIKEEIWFADPDEIESCPDTINIEEIIVRFREGATDIISPLGHKYDIAPHFFIPNKTKLGINTIPESKEHKLAKNWIYNRLIKPNKDNFLINYSKLNKGQHFNQFNLLELPLDKSRINVEVNSSLLSKTRRADIICPFIIRHPILGNGIIFEIQFSKQKEKTRIERELDWAIRGYSIAWLHESDFEYLDANRNIIETKKDSIDVSSFANLIKENKKEQVKQLKFTIQEEVRKLNSKIQDMKEEFEEERLKLEKIKLQKLELDWDTIELFITKKIVMMKNGIQPICPRCKIPMILKQGKTKFWGCANYPMCKMTSNFVE
jgi:competence CoiA-like predicted nuclease